MNGSKITTSNITANKVLTGKHPSETKSRIKGITPVVLAGGKGARLRPLTRSGMPKPFLKVFSDRTLLQETVRRVPYLNNPVVVCHESFEARAREEVQAAGKTPKIIAEPFNKSTAAAIGLAALALRDENKPMLVMPSDHYIADSITFQKSVDDALDRLEKDNLVFIGARPFGVDERYGYILSDAHGHVKTFREKPRKSDVKGIMTRGHCLLNTGIFLVKPQHFLDLLSTHTPEIFEGVRKTYSASSMGADTVEINAAEYQDVPAEAVDYAIMEKLDNAQVVSMVTEWMDLGTWPSFLSMKMDVMFGRIKAA